LAKRESVLRILFSSDVPILRDGDSFFIDRDGKHFRIILDFIENDHDHIKDRIENASRVELFEILNEAKFYGLKELETIIQRKLGIVTDFGTQNVLNHHVSGGKLRLIKYTFKNASAYSPSTEEGASGNSWNNNGTFIDELPCKDNELFSFRTNKNTGSTWVNSSPGESTGILIADLTQQNESVVPISKFCVFQMHSDGSTTHLKISFHPSNTYAPETDDTDWVTVLDWAEIGPLAYATADDLDENQRANFQLESIIKRTELFTVQTFETRFLKFEIKNDGRHGSGNYIELRQIKAFV